MHAWWTRHVSWYTLLSWQGLGAPLPLHFESHPTAFPPFGGRGFRSPDVVAQKSCSCVCHATLSVGFTPNICVINQLSPTSSARLRFPKSSVSLTRLSRSYTRRANPRSTHQPPCVYAYFFQCVTVPTQQSFRHLGSRCVSSATSVVALTTMSASR
jgi:hypothetical protein